MRTTRRNTLRRGGVGALLAAVTLLTSAGAAVADDPSPSANADGATAGPTEAGDHLPHRHGDPAGAEGHGGSLHR